MIKLLFSGTFDGFQSRFASDGILDDDVSHHLLDRRRLLAKDDGRLFRDGYVFQPIAGRGILYHKIILLYDGFWRDGFVAASLFLPEGYMLSGKEIQESLDFLIKGYKASIGIEGMANFDIDWSFVTRKADELNKKVQSIIWKKHPSLPGSSSTALIRGAEGMVSDYFQYPNPLHRSCCGFELVFLTESILNPSMVSDNAETGYKLLTIQDVDITNPEYVIEYTNEQEGGVLDSNRKTITKQELALPGNIGLGTYRKPGYRVANVTLGDSAKVCRDGVTIQVTLPTLELKKAVVHLEFIDSTGKRVSPEGLSIKWSNENCQECSPKSVGNGVYSFEGKCCDAEWTLTVESNLYERAQKNIWVRDMKEDTVIVEVIPYPLWSIIIVLPDGSSQQLFKDVPQKDLDYYIESAKNRSNSFGMDDGVIQVASVDKDTDHHTATVVFKKKEIRKEFDDQSGEGEGEEGVEKPEVTKYYLHLDDKSRNYPLFRNYRKKIELSKDLESEINDFKHLRTSSITGPLKSFVDRFITAIDAPEPDPYDAQSIFTDAAQDCSKEKYWDYISKRVRQIVASLKKKDSIPDVIREPKDIVYDSRRHRLEWARTKCPSPRDAVHFGRDFYRYTITKAFWDTDSVGAIGQKSEIRKELRKKYRTLFFVICPVALIALMLIMFFIFGKNMNKRVSRMEQKIETTIQQSTIRELPESYCGDDVYRDLTHLESEYEKLVKKKDGLSKNDSFIKLQGLVRTQSGLRYRDSLIFHQASALLESLDSFDEDKWNELWEGKDALSQEHRVHLEGRHREIVKEIEDQLADVEKSRAEEQDQKSIKEESELYEKCFTPRTSFYDYKKYIDTYSRGEKRKYSSDPRIGNVKEKFENDLINIFNIGDKPIDKLRDALSDYEKYFSSNEEKIDRFKQMIDEKEKEGQTKKTISSYSELFGLLTWTNIKDGQPSFEKSFKITGNNQKKMKDYLHGVLDAVSNNSRPYEQKQKWYEDAYNVANSETSPTKKFDKLIEELKK